jgi:hypothetical protein
MQLSDAALIAAGLLGGAVALFHGVIIHRAMVRPIESSLGPARISNPVRRLVPVLLHFSTFNWLVSGIALIIAGLSLGGAARLATGLLVASSYAFAVVGNFWATRGRHPGWALYLIAFSLTIFGIV